jgi:predicted GIY-YIG superfamily endonuclease
MKISIYTLTDPSTNKIRYVGQTNDPKRRLSRHINNSRAFKDKRHISNWIRSLTSAPIMDIIEVCEYSIRNSRENYWIDYYKNQGCNLCNSSNGGAGAGIGNKNCLGRVMSKQTRQKIANANKGNTNGLGNKGGKPSKTIYQYDKNKILIAVYDSIQNAVKATGYNRITIRRNIQNISSSNLFIWTDKPLY